VGIYDTGQSSAGNATLLGTTADQTTNFGTPALYTAAITLPFAVTAGQDYFIGLLANGTGTAPKFACLPADTNSYNFINAGLSGVSLRTSRYTTTGTTSLVTPIAAANIAVENDVAPWCFMVTT
jgi:hypothetical protein